MSYTSVFSVCFRQASLFEQPLKSAWKNGEVVPKTLQGYILSATGILSVLSLDFDSLSCDLGNPKFRHGLTNCQYLHEQSN